MYALVRHKRQQRQDFRVGGLGIDHPRHHVACHVHLHAREILEILFTQNEFTPDGVGLGDCRQSNERQEVGNVAAHG